MVSGVVVPEIPVYKIIDSMGGSIMARVWGASWDGECSGCGCSFVEGDEIYFNDDHDLVAVDCCGPPGLLDNLEEL